MGAQHSMPSRAGGVRLRRRAPTMGITTTAEMQGAGVDIAHAVKLAEEKLGRDVASNGQAPAVPPENSASSPAPGTPVRKMHPSAAALQVELPPWEVVANLGESEWLAFRTWLEAGWKCKKCGSVRDDHADHPRAIKLLCQCGVSVPGLKATQTPSSESPCAASSKAGHNMINYASESSDAQIGYLSDQSCRSASSSRGASPMHMHMAAGGRLSRPESPRFANDDKKLSFPEQGERMEQRVKEKEGGEYLGPEACPHLASLGISDKPPLHHAPARTISGGFLEASSQSAAGIVPEMLRKQGDELHVKDKILRAITRANQIYFIDKEPNGTLVFDFLLSALLDITNSRFGWISSALLKADGTPYLKTHAISNLSWNKELKAWYAANAHKGLVFTNLDSLHGSIVYSGQPVISNDAPRDPRAKGVPAGHPPIEKFFGIPLFTGSELIGIYGVANSPEGYTEELMHLLEPLTLTISQMMYAVNERKRRKEAEMQLSSVVQVASEGIMSMSYSGQVTSINMAAREMFGLVPKANAPRPTTTMGEDTAPPTDLHIAQLVPEIDGQQNYLKKGLDPQAGHRHMGVGRRLDGSTFPVEVAITKGSYGTVFYVAVIRDISEEVMLRQKLAACTCGQNA